MDLMNKMNGWGCGRSRVVRLKRSEPGGQALRTPELTQYRGPYTKRCEVPLPAIAFKSSANIDILLHLPATEILLFLLPFDSHSVTHHGSTQQNDGSCRWYGTGLSTCRRSKHIPAVVKNIREDLSFTLFQKLCRLLQSSFTYCMHFG